MKLTTDYQLKILKWLFLFYCGPTSYWFMVTLPIDLVSKLKSTEFVGLLLFAFPIIITFSIFLAKLSYFSRRFEKIIFTSMIFSGFLFILLSMFYKTSLLITFVALTVIFTANSITAPYLFSKILNLVSPTTKIRSITEMYLVWFGGGVLYLILFIYVGPLITFFISAISIFIGAIIQYVIIIKPKKYVSIQLLPFNYKSIANGNILGVFVVLTLFWSVATIIVKEFGNLNVSILHVNLTGLTLIWLFLLINVIVGLIFYIMNKRFNLQLLYYVVYLDVSISVMITLFWKPFLPLAFVLVSTFGLVIFAFSMPDLMDQNKGNIGPSFMAFFQILLLSFPFIHIVIYYMNLKFSENLASFLLIVIIVAMALLSGIKFLPVPVTKEYLIISHKDGIPLYSIGTASNDEKIISGLLTGILTMLNSAGTDKIKTIDHGDKKIMICVSNRIFGVVVCDHYSKNVNYRLQEIVDLFEAAFDKVLDLNSFNVKLFKNLPPLLVQKIEIFFSE